MEKKSPLKILLKFIIPLIISVGLCWLLFRDFDFHAMMHVVRTQCSFSWILLMLAISIFSYIFRALRWRMQLRALGIDPPLFCIVLSIFGTYAVNLVFPRLGEVWRTGYIASRQHAPFTAVFGSMVADRAADTLTVLLLTLLAFAVASSSITTYLRQNTDTFASLASLLSSPWLWAAIIVLAAILWWLLRRHRHHPWLLKVRTALIELWQGFIVVLHIPRPGLWLLWTLGIWGCFFLQMLAAFQAFPFTAGLAATHGLAAVLVTFVLSSISMGVPAQGGIGPWHWAVIFALGIYGLDRQSAGSFANFILGCNTLWLIILGLLTFACIALDRHRSRRNIANTKKHPVKCQK